MVTKDERDPLGARMKEYELATRTVLPRRTYILIRLDGRAFHSYTKKLARPYDTQFMADMDATARTLADEISGTKLAYVQSDEISIVATDFDNEGTQAWFGGQVQKIVSISAATASATFCRLRPPAAPGAQTPTFDSRVFTLPNWVEVENYFIWRQRDCTRNSISMTAQMHFSHKQLHGVSTKQMQELLWKEKGINWNDMPDSFKRGRIVRKLSENREVSFTRKDNGETETQFAERTFWSIEPAPRFVPGGFITETVLKDRDTLHTPRDAVV